MGFLKKLFGTKEQDYKELVPYIFQEAFNLLTEFCIEQADNGKSSDTVEIGTSASALVAASYFTNKVTLQRNKAVNREKLAEEVIDTSNRFFDYVSGSLAKVAEREMGRKIDLNDWMHPVTEKQQDKVGRYIPALVNTIKKISSGGSGFDITIAVTEDLFGEEEADLIFHHKVITFFQTVKI